MNRNEFEHDFSLYNKARYLTLINSLWFNEGLTIGMWKYEILELNLQGTLEVQHTVPVANSCHS